MLIRKLNINEGEQFLLLRQKTFTEAYAAYNTPADMDYYLNHFFCLEEWNKEYNDPNVTFFVAVNDANEFCGYMKLNRKGGPDCTTQKPSLTISSIYVLKTFYGKGLANELMSAAIETAKQEGYNSIVLAVWKENARAIAYYKKTGFLEVGETTFDWGTGKIDEDWWMEKVLKN